MVNVQNEIIDETDRYMDNHQVERVSAQKLVRRLPVRLRADFLKHFTPRHTMSNAEAHAGCVSVSFLLPTICPVISSYAVFGPLNNHP
eukprot:scaffold206628_cov44-Prasinocladus_malaysianus.AAC.1